MTTPRALVFGGGAMAALVLGGALLVRCGSPDPADRSASAGPDRVAVVTRVAGPAGVDHSEEGAVASAMAYSSASQRWLYLTDDEVRDEIADLATDRAAEGLATEAADDISAARSGLSASTGRIWWLVRPLATRVASYSPDHARISVWTVTVLSAASVAVPQTEWLTVDVDLEWERGAWRVDAVRDTPGPTPVPGPGDDPWEATDFDRALEGFIRVDGEPVS